MQGQSLTLFKGRTEMTPTSIHCLNLHTVGIMEREHNNGWGTLLSLCTSSSPASHSIFYPVLLGPLLFRVHSHGLLTPAITHSCDRNKFPILHLTLRSLHALEFSLQFLLEILRFIYLALSMLFFHLVYQARLLHTSRCLYLATRQLKVTLAWSLMTSSLLCLSSGNPLGVNLGPGTSFCLERSYSTPILLRSGHPLLKK